MMILSSILNLFIFLINNAFIKLQSISISELDHQSLFEPSQIHKHAWMDSGLKPEGFHGSRLTFKQPLFKS